MAKGIPLSKFYKSFSGTDTIAFLLFPGIKPIVIGSLTTISYSMYRNKVPVINIGRTSINGITRGSRIYAGTMVFTLINKHWVRELQDQIEYLNEYRSLKVDELPLFDIMIISANEYGNACNMFIYGIDLTDEAQTISVEDLFTENIFKFVARDITVFDEYVITASEGSKKYYIDETRSLKNYYMDEQIEQTELYPQNYNIDNIRKLNRTLYLIQEYPMVGEDVAAIQQLLNMALPDINLDITYKFDQMTDLAVRQFQTTAGLVTNGIVDEATYTKLLEYSKIGIDNQFVQVINKSGAYVYKEPDEKTNITKILPYLSTEEVFSKITKDTETFYQVKDGYVSIHDVFNFVDKNDPFSYETLQYNSEGQQVDVLQNMLERYYPDFKNYTKGLYDEKTETYVKKFQSEHDLYSNGICDYVTWNEIFKYMDENYKQYINNHSLITYSKPPKTYNISSTSDLKSFDCTITNLNTQQVKISTLSKYSNNSKLKSNVYTFDGAKYIDFFDYSDSFNDDVEYGKVESVLFTVYPYGSNSYQWVFNVN